MKCPKCKYNTFEFLDNCKKCGADLRSFKESLGIRPMVLASRQESPADDTTPPLSDDATFAASGESSELSEDTFSWETPPASPTQGPGDALPDVALASPRETPQESFTFDSSDGFSFGDLPGFSENTSEEPSAATPSPTPGEFTFEDFSQEEEIAGSPPQANALHAETDSFSPGEFDFMLEGEPSTHQG